MNRAIIETSCMILESRISEEYCCAEAVSTADVYLTNRSPCAPKVTPEESWNGNIHNREHLRAFEFKVTVRIPKERSRKSIEYIFLAGIATTSNVTDS